MRNTLARCLVYPIAASAVLWAQAPVQPPTAAKNPSALLQAVGEPDDLTSISAVVHDRKGRPVTSLRPEDLSVTDDGAPVKIASLRLANDKSDRMVAFVFGQLDPTALKNANGVAAKILRMFPDRGFSFAVFGIDGRLRFYQQYTTDRSEIARAIEQATVYQPADRVNASSSREQALHLLAQASPASAALREQSQASMVYAALEQSQHLVIDRHTDPNIAGLTAIAEAERQVPGRKAILYFAQSAQPDVNTVDQMHAAAKAANETGTSIFAIDMNAIDPAASQQMASAAAMGNLATSNHLTAPSVQGGAPTGYVGLLGPGGVKAARDNITDIENEGMTGNKSPLGAFSVETGGACVGSRDNFKKPVQRLIADLTSYYEISYSPKIEIYDGRFHPVAVKAQRPGLRIHAQSGYLALPRGEEYHGESIEASLAAIFKSPTPPSDIDFHSGVLQLAKAEEGVAGELEIRVPAGNLGIREDPNTDLFSLHAAIAAQIEDGSGRVVKVFNEDIRRHGGLDSLDAFRTGFITFRRRLALPQGDYVLKTVVVDTDSGKAGMQVQPLHLAAPDAPSLADSHAPSAAGVIASEESPGLEPTFAPLLESSPKPSAAPTPEQATALIAAARKRALAYSAKLPNFMCVEVIDRSVDRSGKSHWNHQDTITELLRYRDNAESRVVLDVNGRRSDLEPSSLKGARSNGEFGGLLKSIFDPAAQADFRWEAEKQLGSGVAVQVLSYRVAEKNSAFGLTDNSNWTAHVAFHGVLYIEPDTGAVRYATVEAQDMPAKFSIRASTIQVVYDYVAINNHDYLLPVRGAVGLSETRHQATLNTLQFRDYKRFASQSRILPVAASTAPK